MGRKKLEIKRIEDKSSRQVTFCKRRNGLMEKARQLSVLCGSSAAIIIVSSTGKVYSSSSGDSMAKILKRYEVHVHANDLKTLDLEEKNRNYLSCKELLEIVQRKLEEANVNNVSVDSLDALEEQLETALSVTKARKAELTTEFVKNLQEKEKVVREENEILSSYLRKMEKKMCMETDEEMTSSGNNPVETLRLLK